MMKNNNFLVDCHVFDGSFQGTTTYIKGLYQELIKDSSKTFFFVSYDYNLEDVFGTHTNVEYLRYTSKNKYYRLLFELPFLIKKHNIDFAHFQYVVPPIKRCRYIVTLHDLIFLDYPKYFPFSYRISKTILYYLSAKYADIVLTVSDFSKERIQHHFNIKDIVVTPNAVEEVFFEEYDKVECKLRVKEKFGIENYFIFISRWEPRKNHHTLLKAFVENEYYRNYSLVFVGKKAIENADYNLYYSKLSPAIKAKIHYFEGVDLPTILLLIRAANLSIYPSIAEGFGIPPLETLAAKIPTICSNTTAMADFHFIKENLFDPYDVNDLISKIDSTLNYQNSQDKRQEVLEKYNWKNTASILLKSIKG